MCVCEQRQYGSLSFHIPDIGFGNEQVENNQSFPLGIDWHSLRSVLPHKSKFNHKQRASVRPSSPRQPRLFGVYIELMLHLTPSPPVAATLPLLSKSFSPLFICLKGSLFSICRGKINVVVAGLDPGEGLLPFLPSRLPLQVELH